MPDESNTEQPLQEPSQEEQAKEEATKKARELPSLLQQLKDAPSSTQIEGWKAKFDEVFVSGFSEEELFVWRPVFRPEYLLLQKGSLDEQTGVVDQAKFEEGLCETCVLYKSTKRSLVEGKAGTISTLAEQIMQNSNFIPAQLAMVLVAKL